MSTPLSRLFRPSLEALEERRVMTVGVLAQGGGIWHAADTELTATVRQSSTYDPSLKEIHIDGSVYDDHVEVVDYATGANGFARLKLEQWSNGTLLTSRTVVVNAPNLKFNGWAINADLKEGNDRLLNNTFAPISASGGAGSDILIGGVGNDFLKGDSGSDGLLGRYGNDVFYGGDDADGIYGGAGNDIIYGDGGNDRLAGDNGDNGVSGAGNDTIFGGMGNDVLMGEFGFDELRGQQGNDQLFGGQDSDRMWGGDGDDRMFGDAGNDRLYGEGGYDRVYGGAGDDFLDAGYKITPNLNYAEYLEGGQGKDTFVRHKSVFGSNDPDLFADYNSATGDRVESSWHW